MKRVFQSLLAVTLMFSLTLNSNNVSAKSEQEELGVPNQFLDDEQLEEMDAQFKNGYQLDSKYISDNLSSYYPKPGDVFVSVSNPNIAHTDVPTNIQPALTFSVPIAFDTDPLTIVSLYKVEGKSPVSGKLEIKNNTLYIRPDKTLESNTKYAIEIDKGAIVSTTDSTKSIDKYLTQFVTNNTQAPIVIDVKPYEEETKVDVNAVITIKYDRKVISGTSEFLLMDENAAEVPATFTVNNDTVTIQPNAPLKNNAEYYLAVVQGAVKDTSGNESYKYLSMFSTGTPSDGGSIPKNPEPALPEPIDLELGDISIEFE
ncbi:Ig-like domain-containing protein [Brevibacillus porteri]|uniref:Ig-like domain-containing protein n=1 Tax=Brevibacillus porteri TaxID=2126350 RepID=UPI003D20F819